MSSSKKSTKKVTGGKRSNALVSMDELRALKKTTVDTQKKREHKRGKFGFTGYYMRTFEGGQMQFSITETTYKQAMESGKALGFDKTDDTTLCTAKFNEFTGTYTITGKVQKGVSVDLPKEPAFMNVDTTMGFGTVGKEDPKPCLYFQVTKLTPIKEDKAVEDDTEAVEGDSSEEWVETKE